MCNSDRKFCISGSEAVRSAFWLVAFSACGSQIAGIAGKLVGALATGAVESDLAGNAAEIGIIGRGVCNAVAGAG